MARRSVLRERRRRRCIFFRVFFASHRGCMCSLLSRPLGKKFSTLQRVRSAAVPATHGYADNYRGWYDASGCGICQDYCRWVGDSGSGGDPSVRTSSGDSFWSCRKAGGKASNPGTNQKDFCPDPSNTNIRNVGGCGTDDYSARGYYGDTFTFEKCSGQGVEAEPNTDDVYGGRDAASRLWISRDSKRPKTYRVCERHF